MALFKVDHCPVCGSKNFSSYLTCTDFFVSGEKFEIAACNSCGFKFTANAADEESIGRYYQSEKYISHSNTSKGLVNIVYHWVRSFMLGRKRHRIEKSTGLKSGKILDVGTGTGFFLNEMKNRGWQVTGTEKSSDARSFAKQEFGLEVDEPEQLFRFAAESFNAITLWHVLEHVHRLDENMDAFYRLLNAQGKLVIAVPNQTSYDARHYKEYWAAWDVPRHLWHFGPEQMARFGQKHGFRLVSKHTMPFDSFYVSMLSEKYKKSKLALLKGLLHGKISWLNSLVNPERCSSVIYVFEK
ncbi:Methyltransferase domain-containing protein [Mariniphaga anaerophila]|uniref:Methyltransferase domain-containing protein n=1 Tax=Mariniphaga anaerophila TaxID=1484053 RepID=A0A1M4YHH7_9BACT|nr:class I SAM-dependent methyltransferase [Mariniphaga anaerophila]SHF05237.1 Methyltransferase domain-containing protein [Mariniphaga anaerophila]